MSDKTTQSSKRTDRVFFFNESTRTASEKGTIPSKGKPYKPRRGDRVFYFKGGSSTPTEKGVRLFKGKRYEPRRGERVFYFREKIVTETGTMPQGEPARK